MFTTDTLPPALSLIVSPKDTALLGELWIWLLLSCVNTLKLIFWLFGFVLFFEGFCLFVLIWVFENGRK